MPRSLFARLFLHSALVLGAFLVSGGFLAERFLAARETDGLARDMERVARAVAAGLPAGVDALQERVRSLAAQTGLRFTVVAPDGTVLADSHRDPSAMENHGTRPEILRALRGEVGRSVRRSATLGEGMLYVAVPSRPVVRVSVSLAAVDTLRAEIRRRIALAAVPALALALALAWLLSRGLTRRVGALVRFVGRTASGDFDTPLPVAGVDELSDLERGLVELRDALRRRIDELRREHGRLEALLRHLPDGVLVLDPERRVLEANPAARRILRMGEASGDLFAPELLRHPGLLEALDRCYSGGEDGGGEVCVDWPDPPCRLSVRFVPLPDETGRRGALVVLRDVTRQHQLERMRTDFVANLSHELRTPLTAIRGAAETLQELGQQDPTAARRFLETIRRNALRLEALLGDVTELARIEAGASPPRPARVDVAGLVRGVLEMFRAESERSGLALEARLPARLEAVTDPDKVESILVNLVQNGIRYTPPGGRVTVEARPLGEGVVLVVEDTGVGIPPQEIPRVTERFYRVDPARSRSTGGTGLGLSIVKHLVELLGGRLAIESRVGLGTRVTVELPDRPTPGVRG